MLRAVKIVFAGDGGVGKTSLIKKFFDNTVVDRLTVGTEFRIFKISPNKMAVLWDLGGEIRFRDVQEALMRGARLVVLVFDVHRPSTLTNLKKWAERIYNINGRKRIPAIVVGNKIDLGKNIDHELIKSTLKEIPLDVKYYIETSAYTGENVAILFKKIRELLSKEI